MEVRSLVLRRVPYYINGLRSHRAVAVVADAPGLTITLTVELISMREVGRSFSVRYDHTGGSHDLLSRDEMAKRDVHSFDRVFTYAYNPTIDERLQLFPFQDLQVAESLLQYVLHHHSQTIF